MTLTVGALAKEPETPVFPYVVITLADRLAAAGPHTGLEAGPPPTYPLRLSLTSNDEPAAGGDEISPCVTRAATQTDSVASFPVDSKAVVTQVFSARLRLLSIRWDLDGNGVPECVGLPYRLIRRALEESSDLAPVSAARQLRMTLD